MRLCLQHGLQECRDLVVRSDGVLLQDSQLLHADLRPAMGEVKPDTVVTMHVIVRPAPAGKPQSELHPLHASMQVHLKTLAAVCLPVALMMQTSEMELASNAGYQELSFKNMLIRICVWPKQISCRGFIPPMPTHVQRMM